jgi:hypothetical protein
MSVQMASPQTHFVLWAKHFDEAVVTTFVCEGRAAGKRVKVVGVDGKKSAGVYGMVVTPDLTLDQAIKQVHQAQYVVLPCPATAYPRLNNDPRLLEFLQKAASHHATLLVGEYQTESHYERFHDNSSPLSVQATAGELCAHFEQVVQYPSQEFLVEFARRLG